MASMDQFRKQISAAAGRTKAKLVLKHAKIVNVFTETVEEGDIAMEDGIILGIGRAIGETMAVVMIAGNQTVIPKSLLSGVRTMTANIVMEMGYATDLHRGALIGTGVVLFVFILLINVCFSLVKKKEQK